MRFFGSYNALITLHHAHLAHALERLIRLARAGGAGLDGETGYMGREVVIECRGGGTLGPIVEVIETYLWDEIIKSKCAPTPNPLTQTNNSTN